MAGPPEGGERGKLARAADLLAQQDGGRASLVNPGASPSALVAGFQDGGWREADPSQIPIGVMEEWVEAAARDTDWQEVAETLAAGVDPLGAHAWWALSGVVARKAENGDEQSLWRAWALALLVQPDLRQALPADAPRAILDRLRMTARERIRALWFHADQAGKWENVASLEQQGRSAERRRRWSALDSASSWAPAWAWEVSRGLADASRPGRNQEIHRIAKWESQHLIENGGEIGLIGLWLRAVGAPAPDPVAPPAEGSPLKVGQAGRVVLALGPGDVPLRSEDIRVASRAAGTCGGWAALRGALDAIDWTEPEARRALRAAVGSRNSRALHSARVWNQLRPKAPRLPEAAEIGIGVQGAEDGTSTRRRRRRRRKMATSEVGEATTAAAANGGSGDGDAAGEGPVANGADAAAAPAGDAPAESAQPRKRRRRRRRRPAGSAASGGDGGGSADAAAPDAG